MNTNAPDRPNPYQPTSQEAGSVPLAINEIPLAVGPVAFAGALTRQDLRRALTVVVQYKGLLLMQVLACLSLLALVISSGMTWVLLIFLLFCGGVGGVVVWHFSGWRQARLMERRVPKIYRPFSGHITSQSIHWQTENGWGQVYWYGVAGIRVTREVIAVALNSQHGSVLIFPKRFFTLEDWEHLTNALTPLTKRLPFQPRRPVAGEARLLTHGEIQPLDSLDEAIPADAIRFQGMIYFQDVMRTAYGHKTIVRFVLVAFASMVAPLLVLGLLFVFFEIYLGYVLLALLIPGAILSLRLFVVLWSTYGPKNRPLVRVEMAVSDEGIWISNPRGIGYSRWGDFGNLIDDKDVLLLRQSEEGLALVVLARHLLVDRQQWQRVHELVTTRIEMT